MLNRIAEAIKNAFSKSQDTKESVEISNAEIDGGYVNIGKSSFRIRDVKRVELIHSPDANKKGLVEVFVGVADREANPVFTPISHKREYVGTVNSLSDSADKIRIVSGKLGIPVIEI